jgi:hypothetical protein
MQKTQLSQAKQAQTQDVHTEITVKTNCVCFEARQCGCHKHVTWSHTSYNRYIKMDAAYNSCISLHSH